MVLHVAPESLLTLRVTCTEPGLGVIDPLKVTGVPRKIEAEETMREMEVDARTVSLNIPDATLPMEPIICRFGYACAGVAQVVGIVSVTVVPLRVGVTGFILHPSVPMLGGGFARLSVTGCGVPAIAITLNENRAELHWGTELSEGVLIEYVNGVKYTLTADG
jgi:hypothetical protein